MNGRVAKKLRRIVYGNMSIRFRDYEIAKPRTRTIRNRGLRRRYLAIKAAFRAGDRGML
jgi:hypothetical protein